MNLQKQNKEFILEYINAISGVTKTRELLEKYNGDPGLVKRSCFLTMCFPDTNITLMRCWPRETG